METLLEQENILDVTAIEPKLKHPTIFERFDEIITGESLTLHNDHDPRPLYYELLAERGNIFNWEYLEQGPQLWRVKLTKTKVSQTDEENILNVTLIEPRLKHPTIFQRFDELKPGESLTIHNDHDPKPLYYQLLGERGNIFNWEYLEQGPQMWKVKISKRTEGESEETLGEIAAKDLRKAEVFKKYGLDFCCGGKKTVKEACAEKGIDVTKVEQELQTADKNISSARPVPYNEWSLDFLADYIVNTHHSYVKKTIPDLRAYATKVASVHGAQHPELIPIRQLVEEVCDELSTHQIKEEKVLFPYIKQLAASQDNEKATFHSHIDTIKTPIKLMEMEHEIVGKNLEQIRSLSNNYTLPDDACASYSLLFKMLDEFENDLHMHVHLENNILFPKAQQMEEGKR